jgi:hypothetical protein
MGSVDARTTEVSLFAAMDMMSTAIVVSARKDDRTVNRALTPKTF